jgi:dienelactone hydrolase
MDRLTCQAVAARRHQIRGSLLMLFLAPMLFSNLPAEGSSPAMDPRWGDLPHTDTEFTPRSYATLEDWLMRREHLRRQLLWSAGLWPEPERTPLNPLVSGRIEREGYTVEKVAFESRPGFFVTGNLYRPRNAQPRSCPGVLNPHGHAAIGRLNDSNTASYQARAITFARMGCVALIWDMVDYNDSALQLSGSYQEKNYWDVHNKPWAHDPGLRALWNINSLGLQLWNSIRALDFLCTLPEVDPERLGCTGESGGGTQTFLLAAVDERVKLAAPVCMVSAYMQGGCNCENAPGLRLDTCNVDFAAMMAPRPMLLVNSARDWTKHTPQVEYPAIRRVYELYGAADRVTQVQFDAEHGYNRDMRNAVYPWFAQWWSVPLADGFQEPPYTTERKEDLLVFNRAVPQSAIRSHEALTASLITAMTRQTKALEPRTPEYLKADRETLGEGLRLSLGLTPFGADEVTYVRTGDAALEDLRCEAGLLRESRRGTQVPVWTVRPEGAAGGCVLLAHGEGRAALAGKAGLVRECLRRGWVVYAVEPFGVGDARPPEDIARKRGTSRYFTTFNRTDDAERIHDLAVALAYCRRHGAEGQMPAAMGAAAFGKAGPWLALAAAAGLDDATEAPAVRLAIDANRFDAASEASYLSDLFVPGMLRVGGIGNVLALLAPNPLLLHNTGTGLSAAWVAEAYRQTDAALRIESGPQGDTAIADFLAAAQ